MFQAGFARVDVTPPLGNPLAGYFVERYADGILDPIELNALAMNDGENTVLVITGDFIYVMESFATPLRKQISEATGVPADHIMVHGLHQHTTIRLGNRTNLPMAHTVKDTAYLDLVARKYCDVARMAIADLAPATCGTASGETAEPISFIRRYRMKDGSSRTNPGCLNPDVVGPIGEADNTVRLVRFFREGKKDIALLNFSTHPDVIGGNKYSADWPGFARRLTEKDLPDCHCLLVNGPQGDTNHINVFREAIAKKGDPDFAEKRYAYSRFMGRTIADVAVALWDKTAPMAADRVFCRVEMVYVPTNTDGMDRIEEVKALKAKMDAGETNVKMGDRAEISRILELKDETLYRKVPVTVLCFGGAAFVGFGGEPFTRYAAAAREAAPELFVMGACCTNGGQGYLPDQSAYAEGGYGVSNSRFSPAVAPMTQGVAKKYLDEYLGK
ncbi:MAG: hypothetical protein IKC69_05230 [Clostridia bacterium]|nr:hypothetical protein [Clostridia bacterium]